MELSQPTAGSHYQFVAICKQSRWKWNWSSFTFPSLRKGFLELRGWHGGRLAANTVTLAEREVSRALYSVKRKHWLAWLVLKETKQDEKASELLEVKNRGVSQLWSVAKLIAFPEDGWKGKKIPGARVQVCSVSPDPMSKMGSDREGQAMISALPEQVGQSEDGGWGVSHMRIRSCPSQKGSLKSVRHSICQRQKRGDQRPWSQNKERSCLVENPGSRRPECKWKDLSSAMMSQGKIRGVMFWRLGFGRMSQTSR